MFDEVTVGWDGGAAAEIAVRWAVERALADGGLLRIVRVADDSGMHNDELGTRRDLAFGRFETSRLAAALRLQHPGLRVEAAALRGATSTVLCGFSGPGRIVVVGGVGERSEDAWNTSRLGQRMASDADGPIAVIPASAADPHATGIVVGVDADEWAEAICSIAARIARPGETISLVHATADSSADRSVLDRLQASLTRADLVLNVARHPESGDPAEAILRHAGHAAAVVVGTHRGGLMRKIFLGSVSSAVLKRLNTPTIVVPPTPDADPGAEPTPDADAATEGTR